MMLFHTGTHSGNVPAGASVIGTSDFVHSDRDAAGHCHRELWEPEVPLAGALLGSPVEPPKSPMRGGGGGHGTLCKYQAGAGRTPQRAGLFCFSAQPMARSYSASRLSNVDEHEQRAGH